jgi:uncharacterized protein (TIGR02996 family)
MTEKDEHVFLQAILEHPEDARQRLVFADWLEERGDPRAELLRVQHQLGQQIEVPLRIQLETRLQSLLASGVAPVGPFITSSLGMHFALIPAGTFWMGSPRNDPDRVYNEPAHPVQITRPFFLGRHTVTVGQFHRFVQEADYRTDAEKDGGGWGWNDADHEFKQDRQYTWKNPGWPQTNDHPVVIVTWNDAVRFCEWLSQREGKQYRLPTEAEWEHACRAGTTTRFFSGDDVDSLKDTANVAEASFRRQYPRADLAKEWDNGYPFTAPVGQFKPNGFGLYDMAGNVWEWCADWYGEDLHRPAQDPQGPAAGAVRVVRGGSFDDNPTRCRAACRSGADPSQCGGNVGFRVVLVPEIAVKSL